MIATCICGSVGIEMVGAPIVSVVCCCDDCQEGARRIEALSGAPAVLDAAGGSARAPASVPPWALPLQLSRVAPLALLGIPFTALRLRLRQQVRPQGTHQLINLIRPCFHGAGFAHPSVRHQ